MKSRYKYMTQNPIIRHSHAGHCIIIANGGSYHHVKPRDWTTQESVRTYVYELGSVERQSGETERIFETRRQSRTQ